MNVEQLIEDGANSAGLVEPGPRSCFALGVRHAIASLFPVVEWEDMEPNKTYWVNPKNCISVDSWFPQRSYEANGEMHLIHFTKEFVSGIRRCPTPSELGVG